MDRQVVSQIHEGIVPVPRLPAVESGRNEGEDLLVGYDSRRGKNQCRKSLRVFVSIKSDGLL